MRNCSPNFSATENSPIMILYSRWNYEYQYKDDNLFHFFCCGEINRYIKWALFWTPRTMHSCTNLKTLKRKTWNEIFKSWEAIPADTATFTPDITPLILAAHTDNYEVIKILLDRGAVLPTPHDIRLV